MRLPGALPLLLLLLLLAPVPCAVAADPSFQPDTDVAGGDYRHFDLPVPRARLCQEACYNEEICQAWTFYRPGLLGPLAICWLKSGQTTSESDTCCVSGVREAKP
jgi:hypothetical protein